MKNLTALMSSYVRAYHSANSNIKIYSDMSKEILGKDYDKITGYLSAGISYFTSDYKGLDPVNWIVNNVLAPSVLARSSFNFKHLQNEIKLGLKQYLILASGYDTSAFKVNNLVKVYEVDKEDVLNDKKERLKNIDKTNINYVGADLTSNWTPKLLETDFDKNKKTFVSLLGISYYLDKTVFKELVKKISDIIPYGSGILFDTPDEYFDNKIKGLAFSSDEEMKSFYNDKDIDDIAAYSNKLIYEKLDYIDINNFYFYNYNTLNPNNQKIAKKGVKYIYLVKF